MTATGNDIYSSQTAGDELIQSYFDMASMLRPQGQSTRDASAAVAIGIEAAYSSWIC